MKRFAPFLAAAFLGVVLATLASPARAGTYTDLWGDPHESGWGMNVVQQDNIAFISLFVYGRDGTPRWYFASDAEIVAIAPGDLPIFSGTLYRATGPWQGGIFDPRAVDIQPAGTISLEALSKSRLRVEYHADDATITKVVERITWGESTAGGAYSGTFRLRESIPAGRIVGTLVYQGDIELAIISGDAVMTVLDNLQRNCVYTGKLTRSGSLSGFSGLFRCGFLGQPEEEGTFAVSEMETTTHGLTGFLRAESPARVLSGRFGAARD
jgi:hypothetical protein